MVLRIVNFGAKYVGGVNGIFEIQIGEGGAFLSFYACS